MLVCFCREIPESRIEAAIQGGARTVAQIFRACAETPNCGGCLPGIRRRADQFFKPCSSNVKNTRSSSA